MLNENFLQWPTYQLQKKEKSSSLVAQLRDLTNHHATRCDAYARILEAHGLSPDTAYDLHSIPFIPVRLFKHFDLKSVPSEAVFKLLTSSGTTGQSTSRIYLDKQTASFQTTVLVKIMQEFLGKARLPMLIIDHIGVIKDRRNFSARGAGILGLSNFGRDHVYALNEDMSLNQDAIQAFCDKYRGQPKFVFGFTFMIWQHFLMQLEIDGLQVDLSNAVIVHSGGWKKLQDIAVDNATFKRRLNAACGAGNIHNFYGMVEQVGSIFVECEQGHLHAPSFADILVRDPTDWSVLAHGQRGVVQVLSCLPRSYPGHSLLTEDLGTIHGEDDCPCGRMGKYFSIQGRLPRAEVRGCSDTQPGASAPASAIKDIIS